MHKLVIHIHIFILWWSFSTVYCSLFWEMLKILLGKEEHSDSTVSVSAGSIWAHP